MLLMLSTILSGTVYCNCVIVQNVKAADYIPYFTRNEMHTTFHSWQNMVYICSFHISHIHQMYYSCLLMQPCYNSDSHDKWCVCPIDYLITLVTPYSLYFLAFDISLSTDPQYALHSLQLPVCLEQFT